MLKLEFTDITLLLLYKFFTNIFLVNFIPRMEVDCCEICYCLFYC